MPELVAAGGVLFLGMFASAARWMSSRVMAPPGPVPVTVCGSTPSSRASRRADGDMGSRMRSTAGAGSSRYGVATEGPTGAETGGRSPGGGEVAGATAASVVRPASRIRASTVPTGTFSPTGTRIFSSTPLTNASISMIPLSVSTSAMRSPRWISLPRLLLPGDEQAGFHVGSQTGHFEFSHGGPATPGRRR